MKTLLSIFSFIFFLCISHRGSAQLPETDIWLFDLKQQGDSFIFSTPLNFTNRPGYDNQPAFSPDGKYILYTSYRDGQSDIYKYDIASKTTSAFCKTPESEYSPTFTPDGKFVSVVRVEKDSAQRVWKFPVQQGTPVLVLKNIDSVGYFAWTGDHHIDLFRLGNPENLCRLSIRADNKQSLVRLKGIPGRTIITDCKHDITYIVLKGDSTHSTLSEFVPVYGLDEMPEGEDRIQIHPIPIIRMLHKKEDFAVYKNSCFLTGDGSAIYAFPIPEFPLHSWKTPEVKTAKGWKLLGDLSLYGLKNMMRMTISPDGSKIAIVSTQ